MGSEFKKAVFACNAENMEFGVNNAWFSYGYFDERIVDGFGEKRGVDFDLKVGGFGEFVKRQEKIFERILIGYKKSKRG